MASRYGHWHNLGLTHLDAATNTPSSVASLVPSSSDSSSAGKLPSRTLSLPIEYEQSTDTLVPSSYKLVAIKLVTPGKEHLEAHCSWPHSPLQTLKLLMAELPRHAVAPRPNNLLTASNRR